MPGELIGFFIAEVLNHLVKKTNELSFRVSEGGPTLSEAKMLALTFQPCSYRE